ncbi:MAG: SPOR domain-containing protein [Candidatus Omnitrophota bacterium]|nr:SPOR domain-containing protein [Candidatus Omnitrophota bacterium]MDZ4242325.1 SPOR domain-containing protein [Candidatus Omnitrophota bacterium]
MNINFHKQSQFELFPNSQARPVDVTRRGFSLTSLTLSLENCIVLSIIGVMFLLVAFSLGVERGKVVSRDRRPAKAAGRSERNVPAVQPAAQKKTAAEDQQVVTKPMTQNPPAAAPASPVPAQRVPAVVPQPVDIPAQMAVKSYTIQVASYKFKSRAEKEAMSLQQKGYETLVMKKGSHVIVCVGKYSAKNDAKVMSEKLSKQYKDCLIRSL